MIIYNAQQGTSEWKTARAGVVTASMFSIARKKVNCLDERQSAYVAAVRSGMSEKEAIAAAGYKVKPKFEGLDRAIAGEKIGDYSDAAKDYAFRLAVERISGEPLDEGFETWQMRRGHELEPLARMAHEARTGLMVDEVGFVTTNDRLFGASADGFIGKDDGAEYKCFIAPDKLRSFHIDNDPSDVIDQVQGGMWITGRKRWHLGLYCPALAPVGRQLWLRTFDRDDNYIEQMELELMEFAALVASFETELRREAA